MSEDFSTIPLSEPLRRGLQRAGYAVPTPVQRRTIPLAIEGKDLLVCAQTGSGKTAAFLLPTMQRLLEAPRPGGALRALILVPTRELARQVQDHFMLLGSYTRLTAATIVGGERRDRQVAALRRNPDIVTGTPGRLLEYLGTGELDPSGLEILILDEADRMLDMGFGDDVLSIVERCDPGRQSMLFSATLHHRGLRPIVDRFLKEPELLLLDSIREQHPDIAHQAILSDGLAQKEQQLLWLLRNESFDKAMVFVNTRERAATVGNFLIGHGVRTGVLHGELEQSERKRIMGLYREGRIAVLVATDLAARGLDVAGVRLVVNLELPRRGESYLHRTGRTGRAGQAGLAISLVGPPEWNRMEGIARYLGLDLERRVLPGLKARFEGPSRRKSPAKSVGRRAKPATTAAVPRAKDRERDRKNLGKRRKPSGDVARDAGLSPPKRRSSSDS